jgi:hypothetical protein
VVELNEQASRDASSSLLYEDYSRMRLMANGLGEVEGMMWIQPRFDRLQSLRGGIAVVNFVRLRCAQLRTI